MGLHDYKEEHAETWHEGEAEVIALLSPFLSEHSGVHL